MSVLIPDEVLEAAHMSEEEFRQAVAVMLFERGKLTMGQACRLAAMPRLQFQHLLASRQIPINHQQPEKESEKPRHQQERDPEHVARVKSIRGQFARAGGALASEELHRERQADKVKEEHRLRNRS